MTPDKNRTVPPTFQDSEKRTWTINLVLDTCDAVQEATGLDLIPKNCDASGVLSLLLDDRQLADVLWVCIEEQAPKKNVDRKAFRKALDADALYTGWEALVEAIVFFIRRKSPKLAEAWQQAVQAQLKFMEANAANLAKTMSSRTTDEALKKKLDELGDRMQADLNKALENSATG
jgi:hypothetical protein